MNPGFKPVDVGNAITDDNTKPLNFMIEGVVDKYANWLQRGVKKSKPNKSKSKKSKPNKSKTK